MPGLPLMLLHFVPLVISAVRVVEECAGALHGQEKQDAAVNELFSMATRAAAVNALALLSDTEFQASVRRLIDDIVAMLNIAAKKGAAPAAL